jgi:hypothetical protein
MSGVFELAMATLRATTDLVYPVRKAIPVNKTQHKRPLDVDEIGKLLLDTSAAIPLNQILYGLPRNR